MEVVLEPRSIEPTISCSENHRKFAVCIEYSIRLLNELLLHGKGVQKPDVRTSGA